MINRLVLEPRPPLVQGATDRLGFRFTGQTGDLGRQTFDLSILDVQRHYTKVYHKWCKGVIPYAPNPLFPYSPLQQYQIEPAAELEADLSQVADLRET